MISKIRNIAKPNQGSATEWLLFWENISHPNRITILIGFLVLMVFVVFLGYFGSQVIRGYFQYKKISLYSTFIEDIRPGTKLRYQGALEIGYVESIESSFKGHRVIAKIRSDFSIPAVGSKASLSSWGYFGAKFINIEINPGITTQDFYTLDKSMPLERVINSSVLFQQYFDAIRNEKGQNSILEKRLLDLKAIILSTKQNKFLQKSLVRNIVKDATKGVIDGFKVANDAGIQFHHMMQKINDLSEYLVYDLNRNLPTIKSNMKKLENSVAYDSTSFSSRILHEETIYNMLLEYTIYTNEKLRDMESAPYKFFLSN